MLNETSTNDIVSFEQRGPGVLFFFNPVRSAFCRPLLNPIALKMVKTLWSFGHSECNRVKDQLDM